MKSKKFVVYTNGDGVQIYNKEMTISSSKFQEIFGIDASMYDAPYCMRMSGDQKRKYFSSIGESADGHNASIEWRLVPESDGEKREVIKKYIRTAREFFPPSDSQLSEWMKLNCKAEWFFEKHMKEGNLLMATEELHVMTQCFYGQALADANIIRNLNEARKLLAVKL